LTLVRIYSSVKVKKIEKIASNMYHQPEIIGKMDIQALKNTVIDFI